jgi:hypothetical protein
MRRVGYYTPETAKMIHDVARYLRDSGFVIPQSGRENQFIPPDAPIYIRNDTAEEIPAFACLQTDGTVEDGGQNFIKVVKPQDAIGTNGWYLFNGIAPIETGGYGIAKDGPVVRMLTDGSAITNGSRWAPVASSFEVSPATGGIFFAIGADDIETDVMRGFVLASPPDQGSIVHFVSPSGGIAARSSLTMGSATCDIYNSSGSGVLSDSGTNETVYNVASSAFAASTHGIAARNAAGLLVAIVEDCGA